MNRLKVVIRWVVSWIRAFINFSSFIIKIVISANKLAKPLERGNYGTLAILANGPSLKREISRISTDKEFEEVDFFVINFFAFEPLFTQIKPRHYCFADPMFFGSSHNEESVRKLFAILETAVNWDMTLYISAYSYHEFLSFSGLKNSKITIRAVNTIVYSGFESLRHFFYRKSLAAPKIQNVSVFAIFVGLNLGYNKLRLYGVDHTFFDSIKVNDQNQLCNKTAHFYDNGEALLQPILRIDTGLPWKVSEYLKAMYYTFKGHDELASYSVYLGVEVTNFTQESLIDAYKRAIN